VGGALIAQAPITLSQSQFVNNTALASQGTTQGGAVMLEAGGTVVGCSFTNSLAVSQYSST